LLTDPDRPEPFRWSQYFNLAALPFWAVHLTAIVLAVVSPPTPELLLLCLGMYYLRMWGITAGYHRYFSHRTFRTSRAFQLVLAWIGLSSAQKGPLWWAAHHRHHHQHSDHPPDVHSPGLTGFLWAHMGWFLSHRWNDTDMKRVADLAKYPELVWLNRYHLVPPVAMAVGLFLVGGLPALTWGFFVSTVLCWHGTFFINSLAHVLGKRRYATQDDSRNSFLLAVITLGEGWHNNHHYWKSSTRQGFFWWEIDPTYYILKALSWIGVVWEIREPPPQVLVRQRIDLGAPDTFGFEQFRGQRVASDDPQPQPAPGRATAAGRPQATGGDPPDLDVAVRAEGAVA
jgi:stearoyl-CoA desaturase (delta-9 desaturase)